MQGDQESYARERRRQVRGFLWLAAVALGIVLWRARVLELFHPGWWRL